VLHAGQASEATRMGEGTQEALRGEVAEQSPPQMDAGSGRSQTAEGEGLVEKQEAMPGGKQFREMATQTELANSMEPPLVSFCGLLFTVDICMRRVCKVLLAEVSNTGSGPPAKVLMH